jgi:hypothetical protein
MANPMSVKLPYLFQDALVFELFSKTNPSGFGDGAASLDALQAANRDGETRCLVQNPEENVSLKLAQKFGLSQLSLCRLSISTKRENDS